jgi:hypothetical protein
MNNNKIGMAVTIIGLLIIVAIVNNNNTAYAQTQNFVTRQELQNIQNTIITNILSILQQSTFASRTDVSNIVSSIYKQIANTNDNVNSLLESIRGLSNSSQSLQQRVTNLEQQQLQQSNQTQQAEKHMTMIPSLPKGFIPQDLTHFNVSENRTHINIDWGNETHGESIFIHKGNQSR